MTWPQLSLCALAIGLATAVCALPQIPEGMPPADYYGGFFPTEEWADALATIPRDQRTNPFQRIVVVEAVDDDSFPSVLEKLLPEPIVRVTGSREVDVSARTLGGRLGIHLVNTAGPHVKPPQGGIKEIPPIGPLTVAISLPREPQSVIQQPEGKGLEVTWANGRASVILPRLEIYSILEVEP